MDVLHWFSDLKQNMADRGICLFALLAVALATAWICVSLMFAGAFS